MFIECPCCGDDGAESDDDGWFTDGQELLCGCNGSVTVDEDDVWINIWDDPCGPYALCNTDKRGRRWCYQEPGEDGEVVKHIVTDAEIIATYYPWWCDQMRKVNKPNEISEQSCIEDWVTVHWAWELK